MWFLSEWWSKWPSPYVGCVYLHQRSHKRERMLQKWAHLSYFVHFTAFLTGFSVFKGVEMLTLTVERPARCAGWIPAVLTGPSALRWWWCWCWGRWWWPSVSRGHKEIPVLPQTAGAGKINKCPWNRERQRNPVRVGPCGHRNVWGGGSDWCVFTLCSEKTSRCSEPVKLMEYALPLTKIKSTLMCNNEIKVWINAREQQQV